MAFDPFSSELEDLPPLWRALSDEDFSKARRLVNEGTAIDDLIEYDGSSILHRAAYDGCIEMVEFCLSCGCPKTIESFDYVSRTPLICAAAQAHLEIVGRLLAAGANPNAHNEKMIGDTAIRYAVMMGHPAVVKMLLLAGADPAIPGWMKISAVDQAYFEVSGGLESRRAREIQRLLARWPSPLRDRACKRKRKRK